MKVGTKAAKTTKCAESGCQGIVSFSDSLSVLITTDEGRKNGYPCEKCGRIYLDDGTSAYEKNNSRIYLRNNRFVYK